MLIKRGLKIAFIMALFVVAVFAWQLVQFLKAPISSQAEAQVIEIKVGSSAQRVAQELHSAELLHSPQWFVWYLRFHNHHQLIKTGEMKIEPQWTVSELAQALIKGETVQYPVTFVAGHTFSQALATVQALPKVKKTLSTEDLPSLYALLNQTAEKFDARYPFAPIEGLLLPETYHYQAGDTDREVLLRAHRALTNVLDKAWQNRAKDLPIQSKYEALTLASIVEKETALVSERPLIAGVFINRLNRGMRLQTDPTVIYGIGQSYDGNIRKRDLITKTPYNTYKINRLPPTPIALASREAIEAVLQPQQTKALYFVASGGGAHYFSNTLEEHNRAVQKYLLSPIGR